MKVYLIEDTGNSPGKIYAVMAHEEDAVNLACAIERKMNTDTVVNERTLFYGQPPILGYNE